MTSVATPVPGERARHLEILQRAENELDPVPFDTEAAWMYGRVVAAVVGPGRSPRRRVADPADRGHGPR
jgi:hypothetical protein